MLLSYILEQNKCGESHNNKTQLSLPIDNTILNLKCRITICFELILNFFFHEKKNKNSRLHFYVNPLRSLKTKTIKTRFAQTLNVLEHFVQSMDPQHKK